MLIHIIPINVKRDNEIQREHIWGSHWREGREQCSDIIAISKIKKRDENFQKDNIISIINT